MKKILLLTILLSCLLMLAVGCVNAPGTPNAGEAPNTGQTPNTGEMPSPATPAKITYTDEFKYLPKHPAMKLKELQKGENGNFDYAYYDVAEANYEKFLTEYEAILKQDGWTVTQDQKPTGLTVQKNDHLVAMLLSKVENKGVLVITSK